MDIETTKEKIHLKNRQHLLETYSLFHHFTISLKKQLYSFITFDLFIFTHSLPQSRRAVMCRLTSFIRSWVRWPTRTCLRRSRISFIMCHSRWKRSPSFLCEIKIWFPLHYLIIRISAYKLIILINTYMMRKLGRPLFPLT